MSAIAMNLLRRYKSACDLKQPFDEIRVREYLTKWLENIGAPQCVIHVVNTEDVAARAAQAARAAWAAQAAQAAQAARAARAAQAAWAARAAQAAQAARATWDAQAAQAAWAARAARDAQAAWDAQNVWNTSSVLTIWDLSWYSQIVIGAFSINGIKTASVWMPLFQAFESGAYVMWIGDADIWVTPPPKVIKTDQNRRLHCADGPAFSWLDDIDLYFWRGQLVPDEWITNPSELTAKTVLSQSNSELRRSGCEILGWDIILKELNARIIDEDPDPEIGTLLEVDLPDSGNDRFVKVKCGTGRTFIIPVPPVMQTALEAVAWTYNKSPTDYKPEYRT